MIGLQKTIQDQQDLIKLLSKDHWTYFKTDRARYDQISEDIKRIEDDLEHNCEMLSGIARYYPERLMSK